MERIVTEHNSTELTCGEILEAFPLECKRYVPKVLRQLNRELKVWYDYAEYIKYNWWPLDWKQLAIGYLDMTKPKDKFSHFNKMKALQGLMDNKREGAITAIDIERAKQYPMERFFSQVSRQGFISCPLGHEDKTPSFKIYPRKNTFYCFSCLKGGDTIRFVMDFHGLRFTDAVKFILRLC